MTGVPDPARLTRDDIAALRCADTVSFHYNQRRGFIHADLDDHAGDRRIFTARQQRLFPDTAILGRQRKVPVSTRMSGYDTAARGIAWTRDDAPQVSAFHLISSVRFNRVWQTIVGLLAVGDEIRLVWLADNNTETLREANLHADELTLIAIRRGRREVRHLAFFIAHAVRLDNSARMIRRFG
jgi:hypothetical protein